MNYDSGSSHKLNKMSFREKAYRYRRFYVHKPAWGAGAPAYWRPRLVIWNFIRFIYSAFTHKSHQPSKFSIFIDREQSNSKLFFHKN